VCAPDHDAARGANTEKDDEPDEGHDR
jgi:hypothetical protein